MQPGSPESVRIPEAPLTKRGYYEARPGDIIGRTDVLVIDLRPEADLTGDFGHIHGVTHVSREQVLRDGLPGITRETPVVLVSNNGRDSAVVATHLVQDHGFREVYNLVGGMVRWIAEERPVARRPTWK